MTIPRSRHRRGAQARAFPAREARWAGALVALVAACGSSGSTLSSPSGSGGAATTAGAGGEAASAGGEDSGGAGGRAPDPVEPFTVAPAVALGWDDRTAAAGLAGLETHCRTVSFGDIDGDGAPDLVLPGAEAVQIFRNDGAGHFALWSAVPVTKLPSTQMICATAIADLDGDGRRDIAVSVDHYQELVTGVSVLFNDGGGAFTRVEASLAQSGLTPMDGAKLTFSVFSIGVLQAAGQPTVLLLANELDGAAQQVDMSTCGYDARGVNVECATPIGSPVTTAFRIPAGTRALEPVSGAGLTVQGNAQGLGVSDFDGDGDDDVLIALDFLPQRALLSHGAAHEDVSAAWGVDHFAHGMGVALGDVDEDGETDAVFSTIGGFVDFKGHGAAGFELRSGASPYQTLRRSVWPWSTLFVDLDDNGHLDLLAINEFASKSPDPVTWIQKLGGPADFVGAFNTVVFKDSATSFREGYLPYEAQLDGHARAKSVAVADIDGDGRLELAMLLLRASDRSKTDLVLGRLAEPVSGHGLTVRLGARAGQGTRVTLTCGGRTQVREIYGAEGMGAAARTDAHFGCGAATTYEALRVEPRGRAAVDLPGGKLDTAVFVEVP